MPMFIGRYNELAQLARFYQENKFQCIIIWGRRRVGKTTLIEWEPHTCDFSHELGDQTSQRI